MDAMEARRFPASWCDVFDVDFVADGDHVCMGTAQGNLGVTIGVVQDTGSFKIPARINPFLRSRNNACHGFGQLCLCRYLQLGLIDIDERKDCRQARLCGPGSGCFQQHGDGIFMWLGAG